MDDTNESLTTGIDVAEGRAQAAKGCDLVHVDRFGATVAGIAHHSWQHTGAGPTWGEVLAAPQVHQLMADIGVEPSRESLQVLMARARGRLWVVTTREDRSLCAGPRFFGVHGRSREAADCLGRSVAQAVGSFRYQAHRSPSLSQLVRAVRTVDGKVAFPRTADLRGELPWLIATGWIRMEGNEIRRGTTAKLDKQRRADARRQLRRPAPTHGEPASTRAGNG